MAGIHFREVCEYGKTHAQCRCPDPSKAVRKVECDRPREHSSGVHVPKHRAEGRADTGGVGG